MPSFVSFAISVSYEGMVAVCSLVGISSGDLLNVASRDSWKNVFLDTGSRHLRRG